MLDQRAFLRIREGGFAYLLTAGQAVSIERRSRGAFELIGDGRSLQAGWQVNEGGRVPVIRLGLMLGTPAGDWQYAILLSDRAGRVAVAAEHVYLIPEQEKPAIQAFNPLGSTMPEGSVITGVCPFTEPEYLVLETSRLQRCLLRAAGLGGA
ncbi:MAG: hypothetical protein WB783_11445 [Arenicellales bacterium]|jgi:hypothetical protein